MTAALMLFYGQFWLYSIIILVFRCKEENRRIYVTKEEETLLRRELFLGIYQMRLEEIFHLLFFPIFRSQDHSGWTFNLP